MGIIMYVFREEWARLFTSSDQKLIAMNIELLKIWLILLLSDNMQHIFQGTLKSLHYESQMLWAYFIIYYPISLPFIVWLSFPCAVTAAITVFAVYMCRMNIKGQIQSVRLKIK